MNILSGGYATISRNDINVYTGWGNLDRSYFNPNIGTQFKSLSLLGDIGLSASFVGLSVGGDNLFASSVVSQVSERSGNGSNDNRDSQQDSVRPFDAVFFEPKVIITFVFGLGLFVFGVFGHMWKHIEADSGPKGRIYFQIGIGAFCAVVGWLIMATAVFW